MPFVDAHGPLAEIYGKARESGRNQALRDDLDDAGQAEAPPGAVSCSPAGRDRFEQELLGMMTALIWAATALLLTGMMSLVGLKAWRGWLDLRRFEIAQACSGVHAAPEPTPVVRIEMADLKERLRKLEAIATGVDL
jgi:hypothetical protein